MKSLILLVVSVWLVGESQGIDLTGGMCLRSSNCGPTEYCDHDFPNPVGKCREGLASGERCLRDKYCKSKKCTLFHCEQIDRILDGACDEELKNMDCPETQYCKESKCVNRKCLGLCKRDRECMSDNCHLFTCVRSDSKGCQG